VVNGEERAGAEASPVPWWGTAAAASQCEGAPPRSDWAGWEADGRAPASADGNGFRTRYADDFALLADHSIRRHRITVEWARLEPYPGRWDDDEVAHLRRVLGAAAGAGVDVWACLLHGTAPGWFTDDQRGWLDDDAVLVWARHVDKVAEAIGDLVAGWVPIHEPHALARLGYGEGSFPPGRHRPDDEHDARIALAAAESEAARLLRSGPAPVAVSRRPDGRHDHDDLVVVSAPVGDLERALQRTADDAGHNGILVVTGDPDTGDTGGDSGDDAAGRAGGSDSGAGSSRDDSTAQRRAARLRTAVGAVADAHGGGVPVVGCFHQPAIDGYEWHRGFDARLGMFDRDRNPRPTAAALPRDA
jgi:beta-glucosidase